MLHVVVDTDFLSAFLKIHQIELIRSFFQVEELLVPPAVYREVAVTTLLPEVVASESIRVQEIEQKEKRLLELSASRNLTKLGAGEQEAIVLAKSLSGSALLMNDKRAGRLAREVGVDVVDVPAFLLACRQSGHVAVDVVRNVIEALRVEDHYEFSKAVLEQLVGHRGEP